MAHKAAPNGNQIILNEDNNIMTDDKDICEFFNKHFVSITDGIGLHDDVMKWKHFPRYWPFVRGIHLSPVNSPHKGQ